jgi:DNA-binding LacI/PurR family transcriptional regulator
MVSRAPEPDDLRRLARAGEVDGMILLQVRLDDRRITLLRDARLPFVAIGRPADCHGLVCVDADLSEAGVVAARHLFSLGHRRIGLLGDAPVFGYQRHALAGFRRAHREAGIPLHRSQLLGIDPAGSLRGALAPFLTGTSPLTALITTTDVEAVSALHVLADAGLRVPEDVSIITLGDSTLAQLARPPITTVGFSVLDESNLAVDLLLKMLDGHPPRQHTHILPVQLLSRRSTGPAGPSPSREGRTTDRPAAATSADRDGP